VLKLRLPEADRERLGLPEWIDYDPSKLMMSEAEILQDYGIEPWDLGAALRGTPVVNPDGTPVMDGDKPKMRANLKAWRFVVWVAARRAGADVPPLADFDLNVLGLASANVSDEAADDPKDPSTPEPDSAPESVPSES
jgi:hypothetical protein